MKTRGFLLVGLLACACNVSAIPTLDLQYAQDGQFLSMIATPMDFPEETTGVRYEFVGLGQIWFQSWPYEFPFLQIHEGDRLYAYNIPSQGGTFTVRVTSLSDSEIVVENTFYVAPFVPVSALGTPLPDGGQTALLSLVGIGALIASKRLREIQRSRE